MRLRSLGTAIKRKLVGLFAPILEIVGVLLNGLTALTGTFGSFARLVAKGGSSNRANADNTNLIKASTVTSATSRCKGTTSGTRGLTSTAGSATSTAGGTAGTTGKCLDPLSRVGGCSASGDTSSSSGMPNTANKLTSRVGSTMRGISCKGLTRNRAILSGVSRPLGGVVSEFGRLTGLVTGKF